jgi:hypothetical protein
VLHGTYSLERRSSTRVDEISVDEGLMAMNGQRFFRFRATLSA